MSTSHYSTSAAPKTPAERWQTQTVHSLAPDWDEPLCGVSLPHSRPEQTDTGAGTLRVYQRTPVNVLHVLIECLWLFLCTAAVIVFDAAAVVYFWGEPECWVFAALTLPVWVLAMATLKKIRSL
jgi:hypothetical protein